MWRSILKMLFMRKYLQLFVVIVLLFVSITGFSKSLGNFKQYHQVTDKEILIESTNGSQILISAYNNYAIGVTVVNSNTLDITTPKQINSRNDLTGSIYVEELDEMMQITTTINDGLVIKIEKSPLHFSFINKSNSETYFEELSGIKFGRHSNEMNFAIAEGEKIEIISNNKFETFSKTLNTGDVYTFADVNNLLFPNNEICLVSSKGYAVVFESEEKHEINLSKSEKVKVSNIENKNSFNYLLIFGPQQPELIDKYAFHMSPEDKQISLK